MSESQLTIGPSVDGWILSASFHYSDAIVCIIYSRIDVPILYVSSRIEFCESYGSFLSQEINHLSVSSPFIEDLINWSTTHGIKLPSLPECLKFLESVRLEAIRENIRIVCRESLDLGLPASDMMNVVSSMICEKVIES